MEQIMQTLTALLQNNNINLQSATNKAIRGTIPAFRVRGHWMINSEYREQDNDK